MLRRRLFWGILILVLGLLLLLETMGIFRFNVWPVFWALFLIFLGVWFLFGFRLRQGDYVEESLSIPRDETTAAMIDFKHGAGKLNVGSQSISSNILEGKFTGGVGHSTHQVGAQKQITLSADPIGKAGFPWNWPEGLRWDVRLIQGMPLDLEFHTGAGESDINLNDLNVKSVLLETGASASRMTLPAQAQFTKVVVKAGMASVNLSVPRDVAARIEVNAGMAGVNVDASRFPKTGTHYLSPDYETATNKVEILVETGMGSVDIR
jgi:predicted membrane protein